ncbi:hypothetical protein C7S20_01680 [Christiangramia fulva]|uniref:DUF192 domain-containing protein n=1 Tax=Christiangramia fulva TaxID=2126553 RepID=A0A2R3Z1D1_9FLAO|nr:DUF192 domain-containing protein [Christiangramia fulva]AVR44071.1 hypothetical protein C7S20_01680 [Christiangramia fulva]
MRKNFIKLASLSLILNLSLSSCNEGKKQQSIKTEPISFKKEGELYLLKKESGDTIEKLDIEIADTDYEHETGLMYRDSMKADRGMLFIYPSEEPRYFYMKNTYIPLDIIYYDKDSSLVSIQKNAVPRDETSLPSEGPSRFILEVNAGKADEWNLEKGDKINFHRIKD